MIENSLYHFHIIDKAFFFLTLSLGLQPRLRRVLPNYYLLYILDTILKQFFTFFIDKTQANYYLLLCRERCIVILRVVQDVLMV